MKNPVNVEEKKEKAAEEKAAERGFSREGVRPVIPVDYNSVSRI